MFVFFGCNNQPQTVLKQLNFILSYLHMAFFMFVCAVYVYSLCIKSPSASLITADRNMQDNPNSPDPYLKHICRDSFFFLLGNNYSFQELGLDIWRCHLFNQIQMIRFM